MTAAQIQRYLEELGNELQKKQVTGEIILAGGAVMLLVIKNRETTKDIDAYFTQEPQAIREAAEVVAMREGLPPERRADLVADPIAAAIDEEQGRWAALCAAAVEWLCWQDRLPFPTWTAKPEYILRAPWFLYPGWRLRAWQLATTPAPFKLRNIFGGDRILDRV